METGGPAFPEIRIKQIGDAAYNPPTKIYKHGMTLRDWFAGQALNGLLSGSMWKEVPDGLCIEEWAYDVADEMLKRRNE